MMTIEEMERRARAAYEKHERVRHAAYMRLRHGKRELTEMEREADARRTSRARDRMTVRAGHVSVRVYKVSSSMEGRDRSAHLRLHYLVYGGRASREQAARVLEHAKRNSLPTYRDAMLTATTTYRDALVTEDSIAHYKAAFAICREAQREAIASYRYAMQGVEE